MVQAQKQAFRGTLDELTAKRKQLRDATREMKTKNAMIGSGTKIEEQVTSCRASQKAPCFSCF